MLILDVVFGHSDNQGLDALNPHFFAGPNMYGQNLDYRNPAVRAILLEMQRRKVEFRRRRGARRRRAGLQVVGRPRRRSCATTTTTCRAWPTSCRRSPARAIAPGSSSRTAAPGRRRTGSCLDLPRGDREPARRRRVPVGAADLRPQHAVPLHLLAVEVLAHPRDAGARRELDLGHRQPRHAAARHAGEPQAQHQHPPRRRRGWRSSTRPTTTRRSRC